MRTLRAAPALLLALLAPHAAADHGYQAHYAGVTDAWACELSFLGDYVSGGRHEQAWAFTVIEAGDCPHGALFTDACVGIGSVEFGFTGSCASGRFFVLGGTWHAHPCCEPADVDAHGAYLQYGGAVVASSGTVVVTNL